jgi:hypothetical protein
MMDETLGRALIAAAHAFAEELERGLTPQGAGLLDGSGSAMFEVLGMVRRVNEELHRGANDEEMRAIAQRVGMDPRGLAGYYSAGLLEKRDDGRWLCAEGQERLGRLTALRGSVVLDGDVRETGSTGDVPESVRSRRQGATK